MTSTAGLTTTWADAAALVVRSDVTAVVVSILLFGAWAAAGALGSGRRYPGHLPGPAWQPLRTCYWICDPT
jgi:hypothetical protein